MKFSNKPNGATSQQDHMGNKMDETGGVDTKTLVNLRTSEGRLLLEMGCPVWHCSLTIEKNCLRIMLQDIYICNPEVCEMLGIISVTECKEKRLQGFAKKEGFF